MKVLSISNFDIKHKNNSKSFKGTDSNYNTFINTQVNDFFIQQKPNIILNNKTEIVQNLKTKVEELKSRYIKFADDKNKVFVFQNLAEIYYRNGNIEKAAALTFEILNNIFDDKNLSDDEKYNKIFTKQNKDIIDSYINMTPFNTSNCKYKREHNTKLMVFASETMNKLGYKEFLPYAEKMCEVTYQDLFLDLSLNDYRKINTPARKLINKYYNLHKLKTFLDKDQYYKNGMFNVLSRWGLPEHSYILKEVIDNDGKKSNKLKAIETIGNIGDCNSISLLENFLNLKRNGFFTIDSDYNMTASLALSRINHSKAEVLNNKYLNNLNDIDRESQFRIFLKVACRNADPSILPALQKVLDTPNIDKDIVNRLYYALAQIPNAQIKDFMIENLSKFKDQYYCCIWGDLVNSISFQKVNVLDMKKIAATLPIPKQRPSEYSEYFKRNTLNDLCMNVLNI